MGDFFKLFRRQRSKQSINETSNNQQIEPATIDADDDRNFEASYKRHMSVCSEYCPGSFAMASHKPNEGFKEPKGWRKSLRKLKLKKTEAAMSISSDNIPKMQMYTSVPKETKDEQYAEAFSTNKRWSYSPDLLEENVPGARELRGTIERKLSVKKEVDEKEQHIKQHRKKSDKNKVKKSTNFVGDDNEYVPYSESDTSMQSHLNSSTYPQYEHPVDNRLDNSQLSTFRFDEKSHNETHSHLARSHSTPNANEHIQDPLMEHGWSAYGSEEWTSSENQGSSRLAVDNDTTHTTSTSNQSFSSMHPSTSGQSASAGSETPDEGNNPHHFEDIDEALGGYEARPVMLDSLHGQEGTGRREEHNADTIRTLTSSLMRGRTITKYERDAEFALESFDYRTNTFVNNQYMPNDASQILELAKPEQTPTVQTTGQLTEQERHQMDFEFLFCSTEAPVHRWISLISEVDGALEDLTLPTSDDNISWDSDEFDADSDQSLDETKKSKDKKRSKKMKDSDRELPKKRFWDRTSLKKKAKATDTEPSLFVDYYIPAERHASPQLPTQVPASLNDNQLQRRRIVATILSSEQSYIESLQRLETDYKQALLDSKPPLVGADVVEKIFYKISAILQSHRLFQMALSAVAVTWDEMEEIGGTFVASFSKLMVLECYGDFINNFTSAMDTVRKACLRKPQFLTFLRDRQSGSKDRLNLYALMLKPVQRFPQFIMLVQDLLKHTPPDHRDRLQLQLALTELETLADRLNQRKAHDEDASDFRSLLENSNLKLSGHTKDGRERRLVKQGDVRECEYNDDGLLEKVKDCLLVLTNDQLICCAINNSFVHMNGFERRLSLSQSPSSLYDALHHTVRQISSSIRKPHQRGMTSTYKDMYKLKWRVNLGEVEVSDGPPKTSTGNDREALIADFITMQEISRLVGKLHLSHEGVTSQVVERCLNGLEVRVRQAEQIAAQPEDSSFSVKFPGKSDTVARTLVLTYNSQKEEWLEAISRAKLANAPSNLDSWFTAEGADVAPVWDSPLFLRSLSSCMGRQSLQVQCAYAFMPSSHVTLLWLSCAASTVIALVSVYYVTEEKVEKVHVMQVESSVQCMEHWNPSGGATSVWLGMESGCLLEYSADGSYRKLSEVAMPTMSTVMIMKAHANVLYVGLLDGTLAMYRRNPGCVGLDHVSSIVVGTGPLLYLSPEHDKLWGCSGNNVVTIDTDSFSADSSRSLLLEGEDMAVSLVTRVGRGLWVTFAHECTLNLYHLDSLRRLQEINLARVIRGFVQSLEPTESVGETCHITSLTSAHSQLFVGTSSGLLLAMPLPKLPDSVPKITGPCKICRHALSGPLSFLYAAQFPLLRNPTPFFDEPPPVPRRDDLDDTLVPSSKDADDDKRSTLTPSKVKYFTQTPPDSPPTYREAISSALVRDVPVSPHRPPLPSKLALRGLEKPFESSRSHKMAQTPESVLGHQRMESLVSPRTVNFVKWNRKSARYRPLLLACGEGYKKLGAKTQKQWHAETDLSPSIVCWKVTT